MPESTADIRTAPITARAGRPEAFSRVWDALCCFFSFTGRIDRGSYWTVNGTALLVMVLTFYVFDVPGESQKILPFSMMAWLVTVAASSVKRAHDFDEPGWWALTMLLGAPIVFLVALPGVPWANRFGAPPPGWMRIGRRDAAEKAETAVAIGPESTALAQRLVQTCDVNDAKLLIRHMGGRVEYAELRIFRKTSVVFVELSRRWWAFNSEDEMVLWALAEVVPAVLGTTNEPVSAEPKTSVAWAQSLAETRYVDDAKSLIRSVGGTVAYAEKGAFFKRYEVRVEALGRRQSFRSEHDMVQWVLAEIVPAVLSRPGSSPVA